MARAQTISHPNWTNLLLGSTRPIPMLLPPSLSLFDTSFNVLLPHTFPPSFFVPLVSTVLCSCFATDLVSSLFVHFLSIYLPAHLVGVSLGELSVVKISILQIVAFRIFFTFNICVSSRPVSHLSLSLCFFPPYLTSHWTSAYLDIGKGRFMISWVGGGVEGEQQLPK